MSGSSLVQIIVMPALIVFFFICLWISKRLGWIVNPFHAYMIPRTIGDHVEPDRPMLWDVYTTQGVKGDGGINWAQMKPFAAAVDCAQEEMLVAVTIAMPSKRIGGDGKQGKTVDLWDDEEGSHHQIGLSRVSWLV
ncbi:hypothetical protein FIBSPDRAFT_929544 [Athelia psychrophila]|uniref:Uncharacterized protein n=1 Tax=Athelia psychrophila TaxID=1759441 RepID=A0A166NGH5_9AGAM|nr:hypothetical protein FIBSPDRAFT_929544 [Fibularhizoctonia sp. CBS 109695]